jgi:preprotein translocase subunit SecE
MTGPFTDSGAIAARRHDELLANHARAKQQVEDYQAELGRLRMEHAEIVWPDARLWWGVAILIVFTVLGVVLLLWVMATGPHDLTALRWVLYPFIGSLVVLIGYIVVYLVQLTRNKDGQSTASA